MTKTRRGTRVQPLMDHGTVWSEAELALFTAAALLGSGMLLLLRVVDRVIEAWPLPTSRARR